MDPAASQPSEESRGRGGGGSPLVGKTKNKTKPFPLAFLGLVTAGNVTIETVFSLPVNLTLLASYVNNVHISAKNSNRTIVMNLSSCTLLPFYNISSWSELLDCTE